MGKYTPLFDDIVSDYGPITALVYGYVWRMCQLKNGVCHASFQTMADKMNVSRRTVIRHIKSLIEAGLIEDLTPDAGTKPHRYLVTESHQDSDLKSLSSDRESLALVTESHQTSDFKSPKDTIKRLDKETTKMAAGVNPYWEIIPEALRQNGFIQAWADWLNYTVEANLTFTPKQAAAIVPDLAKMGEQRAKAAIEESIKRGWKSIYEPRDAKENGAAPKEKYGIHNLEDWIDSIPTFNEEES